MKIKHLLTLLLTMATLPALAQGSGIKGKVVSRGDRAAIEQVKITLTPGERQATSDAEGRFRFDDVASGDYTLTFEADDYEPLEIKVRVDKLTKDVRSIALVPVYTEAFDDSIFAEFDTETANDTQSLPSSLSSSKDVFNNIASYKFGEMRFNLRGYDSQYTNVYFNGIRLNDALTGYTPWSLWSGLNDATRNQENTTGLQAADYGLGGIGGTTNINATASQIRKGLRVSLVNGNSMYRFRAMVSYASGLLDNGWSYAFSVSTRQGGNDWVNGIYYNCFGYYGSVEKRFNERNRLAFTILGAPTERGAQQASTQEVYDLVGNNYYNPNWGYQDGKKRNARVRNNHEPLMVVNYTNTPDDRTKIDAAASFRFGTNGYSALTWKGGADPRPDYYRNLPSYYMANNQFSNAAQIAELWRTSYDTRQINWDRLYDTNYRGEIDEGTYGAGHRSNYMIEERHTDQLDLNLTAQIARTFRDNSRLVAGILYRWNRTEYYDKVKDLLGGDYWVDIDKFAERDFVGEEEKQNDLHYYYEHGHARRVEEGDKFGYDYYANIRQAKLWAMYNFNIAGLDGTIGGEVGQVTMWRDGRYMKGTYPSNSFGNSEALDYFTYQAKLNLAYRFSAAHSVEFNAVALQNAPTFQNSFISPRTRNEVTPGLKAEKIWGVDASYNLSYRGIKARLSGYYTMIHDQTDIISYYDDLQSTFVNFAISGIDKKFFGLEFGMTVPLYMGLSLNGAVSVGQFENPLGRRQQHRLLEGHARGEHAADGRQRRPVVPQRQQLVRIGRPEFLRQQLPVDEPAVPHRRGIARRSDQRRDCRDDPHDARTGEIRLGLRAQCQPRQELVHQAQLHARFQPRSEEHPQQSGYQDGRLRADASEQDQGRRVEHQSGDLLRTVRSEIFLHVRDDLLPERLFPFLTADHFVKPSAEPNEVRDMPRREMAHENKRIKEQEL